MSLYCADWTVVKLWQLFVSTFTKRVLSPYFLIRNAFSFLKLFATGVTFVHLKTVSVSIFLYYFAAAVNAIFLFITFERCIFLFIISLQRFQPTKWPLHPPTITASSYENNNYVIDYDRIRKLTERECFRLMDVSDSDIDLIQSAGISMSQQFKLAGNSIVVNVLYHIFRTLFIETADYGTQLNLFWMNFANLWITHYLHIMNDKQVVTGYLYMECILVLSNTKNRLMCCV